MIPLKNLRKVCSGCQRQVSFLMKQATKQHNAKNYSLSIFLTIIALEETSKFAVYCDHLRKLKPVSTRMQKKLRTNHNYKIFKIFKTEIENDKKLPKDKQIGSKLLIPIMLGSLNFVKQFILYYDMIDDKSLTLQEHFLKHEMPKNNLAHYGTYLWRFTNILFQSELLKNQYAKIDGNIYSDSNILNSKEYANFKKDTDEFTNPKVLASEEKARLVIDELKILAKKFGMFFDYK